MKETDLSQAWERVRSWTVESLELPSVLYDEGLEENPELEKAHVTIRPILFNGN